NTIIIVDPALNPDGVNRFANWVNMNKSFADLTDPNSRVFNEVYPGGRTNHYWFDMNRDYLLLTNPESRGRVAKLQEWKPNIVTDHHEMGSNSTFFFQPGVPSRNNPLTPEKNYILTHAIADYHAKHLDQIGSLYFSEEQFDDYYFGKGSSYPDINSGIGILFEQASSRGFLRKTPNGILSFPFTIRNQFTVTLSTLEAAVALRTSLLDYQKEFYTTAFQDAKNDPIAGWIFGDKNDIGKTNEFLKILSIHAIEVEKLSQNFSSNGKNFDQATSYYIAANQKNYRLLKTMFESSFSFADKTFYDVSTWNFFYSFNMPFVELLKDKKAVLPQTEKLSNLPVKQGKLIGNGKAVAYAFSWNEYFAPRLLAKIQAKGLITKVATNTFSYQTENATEQFSFGTILIPAEGQVLTAKEIQTTLSKLALETGIDIYNFSTGLTPTGIDLGSSNFENIEQAKVLMFVEGRANSRDVGEIWHLFDQRYNMPISLVEQSSMMRVDLSEYNTIILAGGSYDDLGKSGIEKLKHWLANGGKLITYKEASVWANKNLELGIVFKKDVEINHNGIPSYVDKSAEANVQEISGAIFEVTFDPSHPLAFGYDGNTLPIFKTGTLAAELPKNDYSSPFRYTSNPLKSGYCSVDNLDRIKNAPFVITNKVGRGTVISILDNTNFRGFWYGSNKVFTNAVVFGQIL
ncbi:MAG: hypothetical protein JW729_02185, partial [Bacteroidales bacterium]|nr:hypothetical protein [Bacteroidales bacterium]